MAYDAARARTVLFGGKSGQIAPADTWAYDGTTWSQVATTGPEPRWGHAMAYDAARQRVVLFGGYGVSSRRHLDDTWEWDGSAWTARPTLPRPAARVGHALAEFPLRSGVALTGGLDANSLGLDDVWLWDGSRWVDLSAGGTAGPRYGHATAYHAGLRLLVMSGGVDPTSPSVPVGVTWLWDGSTWFAGGPRLSPIAGRLYGAMAYDAARDRLVHFGGYPTLYNYPASTFEWHGVWSDPMLASPGGRERHAMAFDLARQRVVLYGGFTDAYSFTLEHHDTWELMPFALPPPMAQAEVFAFGLDPRCATAAGKPFLDTAGALPWIGESLDLFVGPMGGTLSPAPYVMLFGLSRTTFGSLALPLALTGLGRPDCTLQVSADAVLAGVATTAFRQTLPIPFCAPCVGVPVFAQALGVDAGSLVSTNAIALVLGRH